MPSIVQRWSSGTCSGVPVKQASLPGLANRMWPTTVPERMTWVDVLPFSSAHGGRILPNVPGVGPSSGKT